MFQYRIGITLCRRKILGFTVIILMGIGLFIWKTWADLLPLPESLTPDTSGLRKAQVLDRRGIPLSVTFQNPWNFHHLVPLHEIPPLLQQAFILAEDQRFYLHGGVDWKARMHALVQNLKAFRAVRGASTITEQVVRMLHPRPRTLWSRWLEGIEASRLEKRFSKATILEFYLNQVPYARQRRGVAQAAYDYFDRDLDTLSAAEMLALAVLVRAPSRLDLNRGTDQIQKPLIQLARRMYTAKLISAEVYQNILQEKLDRGVRLSALTSTLPVQAGHFIQYIRHLDLPASRLQNGQLYTTLDASLQKRVQEILDQRLLTLRSQQVAHGAVLVVDHLSDQILAWVNGGTFWADTAGSQIDAILTPRQPGSTLKPFLYAMALEKGWTAATLIEDSPLAQPVGLGLHNFHNYSQRYYGLLRLRDALGNSLNIPAVRTIQFVGVQPFLERLHDLGFSSLTQPSDFYGEGLALGNGEVTLFELVQAYATLARGGVFRPLKVLLKDKGVRPYALTPTEFPRQVYSKEVSSLIADILSDPQARQLEFGDGHLLRFPVQTAVKTGTSTDYRDAWAIGFSYRYTVGVWMGNLDRRPMGTVTGSTGPALVLRGVFNELNRYEESRPLSRSPQLTPIKICRVSGQLATPNCPALLEWFEPNKRPVKLCPLHGIPSQELEKIVQEQEQNPLEDQEVGRIVQEQEQNPLEDQEVKAQGLASLPLHKVKQEMKQARNNPGPIYLLRPTPGLQLAMDPRIPDELEAFPFLLPEGIQAVKVDWIVDKQIVGSTSQGEHQFLWPLSRGIHKAQARVWLKDQTDPVETPEVEFVVK
jgi:penicillin-binding protein 1C